MLQSLEYTAMQSSSGLLLPPALTMMDHVVSGNHIAWDPGFHLWGVCSNSASSNGSNSSSSSSTSSGCLLYTSDAADE